MTFIKICGLKKPETAKLCAELGVQAIGCVFYPKSPRHLSCAEALAVTKRVPESMLRVAVMVDPQTKEAVRIAEKAGCNAVQLHGNESPQTALALMEQGFQVIKSFYMDGNPSIFSAENFPGIMRLVEAGSGKLPGGNATIWDWSSARRFAGQAPWILAGGLAPDNITQVLQDADPWGVDVSSGVESAPGIKDHEKIRRFVEAVRVFDAKRPSNPETGKTGILS